MTKRTKAKPATSRRIKRKGTAPFQEYEYFEVHLNEVLDILFAEAEELFDSDAQFSRVANVSYATVLALHNRLTRLPRLDTIWRLARACGVVLVFQEKGAKVGFPKLNKKGRTR